MGLAVRTAEFHEPFGVVDCGGSYLWGGSRNCPRHVVVFGI